MELQRIMFSVYGLVQGVGFRYFVVQIANKYNSTGYVRNNYDGSVVGEIQSDIRTLELIIKEIRQGPSRAIVDKFDYEIVDLVNNESSFEIKR